MRFAPYNLAYPSLEKQLSSASLLADSGMWAKVNAHHTTARAMLYAAGAWRRPLHYDAWEPHARELPPAVGREGRKQAEEQHHILNSRSVVHTQTPPVFSTALWCVLSHRFSNLHKQKTLKFFLTCVVHPCRSRTSIGCGLNSRQTGASSLKLSASPSTRLPGGQLSRRMETRCSLVADKILSHKSFINLLYNIMPPAPRRSKQL